MTKRMTIVEVFDWDDADSETKRPPSNLLAFQKWLEEQIKLIPTEYKEKAEIDINGYLEIYEQAAVSITIKYERRETDEEELIRENKEKAYKERYKK